MSDQQPEIERIEKEWRAKSLVFTDDLVRDLFPEAPALIFPAKRRQLKADLNSALQAVRQGIDSYQNKNPESAVAIFERECVKQIQLPKVIECKRQLAYFNRIEHPERQVVSGLETRETIERAKAVPIVDIADREITNPKRRGKSFVLSCPWHKDRSPSLHLYYETNSFYCYSCHQGGDVIRFIQILKQFTFPQAIHYLTHL